MRSFLKYLSTRTKYCSPFRKLVELKTPLSIIGVAQGRPLVAAVPQVVGKISAAVFATPLTVAPEGLYVFRIFVPNVFGKFATAKLAKAGSGNVICWLPVEADARSGSTPKKKKNWRCGMIGPPIVPEKLLL